MKKVKVLLLTGLLLASFTSCKKETKTPTPEPTPAPVVPQYKDDAFRVYLLDVTNSVLFPTNVYFRTRSGNQYIDSTSAGGKTIINMAGGDLCSYCSGSGCDNYVSLKVLNNAANTLEVCCVNNSTITILGYFHRDANNNNTGFGEAPSVFSSTATVSSSTCDRLAVKI
jgi:hypothetical protein